MYLRWERRKRRGKRTCYRPYEEGEKALFWEDGDGHLHRVEPGELIADGEEDAVVGLQHVAWVVRSRRTVDGPRQEKFLYLGSIPEAWRQRIKHRVLFRLTASARLDAAGIEGADRERIEAGLERVVPRPVPRPVD